MHKQREHEKMIDIYESDLEDYFKYLMERVNTFLNCRTDYVPRAVDHQKKSRIKKKVA